MKLKYILTSFPLMAMALLFTNCIGDLDVLPLDNRIISSDKAYDSAESYTKSLSKIYSIWSLSGQDGMDSSDIQDIDAGHSVMIRAWFTLQESSSDLTKCGFGESYVATINKLEWSTARNDAIQGIYYRNMYVVALVNEFLKNIDTAPAGVPREQYAAEARFCRALAYYTLLDVFGYPPFITENNYSINPSQLSRVDLFNWIESELLAVRGNLSDEISYGRANCSVVNALLARLYLNAEVYSGTSHYTECVEVCKAIFTADKYSLADDYKELFMADNGDNPNANKEIIFPAMFDGNVTQSWGMGAIILGSRSGDLKDPAAHGINGGWNGYRSTGNLVRCFEFESNDESSWSPETIKDKRGIFDNSFGQAIDITTTSVGTFNSEGWSVYKYTNMGSDGVAGSHGVAVDTDFPLFRLADIYLMYAEAVARGGSGGEIATAVGYINLLRARGYGDHSGAIDAGWLSASAQISGTTTTASSVPYGNILNERARELYWEGTRRTDLIRYGLYTSSDYLWAEKGGVSSGVGVNSRYNLCPIPQSDMSVNSSLIQNDGYL